MAVKNTPPTSWQFDHHTQTHYLPVADGPRVLVDDLRAWEKTQKGELGKDLLRGKKLKERLELFLAARSTT